MWNTIDSIIEIRPARRTNRRMNTFTAMAIGAGIGAGIGIAAWSVIKRTTGAL